MPPDGYTGPPTFERADLGLSDGTCMEIIAIIERSRLDPDMALIETVVASDMNEHAKMRVIERILR